MICACFVMWLLAGLHRQMWCCRGWWVAPFLCCYCSSVEQCSPLQLAGPGSCGPGSGHSPTRSIWKMAEVRGQGSEFNHNSHCIASYTRDRSSTKFSLKLHNEPHGWLPGDLSDQKLYAAHQLHIVSQTLLNYLVTCNHWLGVGVHFWRIELSQLHAHHEQTTHSIFHCVHRY